MSAIDYTKIPSKDLALELLRSIAIQAVEAQGEIDNIASLDETLGNIRHDLERLERYADAHREE